MSAMKKSDGENIFGRRLKNARTMLGLSMDEVVCKMGDAVSKITSPNTKGAKRFREAPSL